jgi:hypothetical protein
MFLCIYLLILYFFLFFFLQSRSAHLRYLSNKLLSTTSFSLRRTILQYWHSSMILLRSIAIKVEQFQFSSKQNRIHHTIQLWNKRSRRKAMSRRLCYRATQEIYATYHLRTITTVWSKWRAQFKDMLD